MSTKTMRLPPKRLESNNKRKEASFELPNEPPATKQAKFNPVPGFDPVQTNGNRVLAGYLAHEFLTRGSIFGCAFDPARSGSSVEPGEPKEDKTKRYVDVTRLLMKTDGAHISGIVNPSQLARFLQI